MDFEVLNKSVENTGSKTAKNSKKAPRTAPIHAKRIYALVVEAIDKSACGEIVNISNGVAGIQNKEIIALLKALWRPDPQNFPNIGILKTPTGNIGIIAMYPKKRKVIIACAENRMGMTETEFTCAMNMPTIEPTPKYYTDLDIDAKISAWENWYDYEAKFKAWLDACAPMLNPTPTTDANANEQTPTPTEAPAQPTANANTN